MPVFSQRFLEDLKLRADIVDVVSSYIPLTKSGSNYKALCPFHREKTPSFFVSPQKQIFHCFGCGKGGNVFSFVMEYEKVSFPEAVEILARRYNLTLPDSQENYQKGANRLASIKNLYAINKLAMSFFHKKLFSREGKKALDYLTSRGVDIDTIKLFGLGYAPEGWDNFLKLATSKKATEELIIESGLAVKSAEKAKLYDRFRNRIMFPVFDVQGRVVGFGGRVLDDSLPKYINSPDTKIFKKSNLLYGLHIAKKYITQSNSLIIVEGYMDVIGLFQAGVRNCVATLGTALGEGHITLLSRYTKTVILLFDPDQAGVLATLRAVKLFLPTTISVRVAQLPKGLDPDEFVRLYGKERFLSVLKSSKDGFEFLLEGLSQQFDINDLKQKSLFLNELFLLLKEVQNSIIQSGYFKLLAEFLKISEGVILREYNRFLQRQKKNFKDTQVTLPVEQGIAGPEVELVKLALLDSRFTNKVKAILKPTDFENVSLLNLWEYICERWGCANQISDIILALQSGEISVDKSVESWLYKISLQELTDSDELFDKAVKILNEKRRKRQIQLLQDLIRQKKANKEDSSDLLRELNLLLRGKKR